jgi:hypothetical protein
LLAHLRCGNFGELKLAYGVAGVCHALIITCREDRPEACPPRSSIPFDAARDTRTAQLLRR